MGFLSFHLNYYKDKLERYESGDLDLYEAKQLLKLSFDLMDEGYPVLHDRLEAEYNGFTRLQKLLSSHNEKPFARIPGATLQYNYTHTEHELNAYLTGIEKRTDTDKTEMENAFLPDVLHYCEWIGYDEDTAYVFLLRDALLPYFYFKRQGRKNLYPWLIGRKFLNNISSLPDPDDTIRAVIYEALEREYSDFSDFFSFFRAKVTDALQTCPEVTFSIKTLLSTIDKEKIMVIESGCYGTFPMLFSALDERVEFRMFTAAPYLQNTYRDKIYTNAYEKNRLFETLFCQDRLFEYAAFRNRTFYVHESADRAILQKAQAELCRFFSLID